VFNSKSLREALRTREGYYGCRNLAFLKTITRNYELYLVEDVLARTVITTSCEGLVNALKRNVEHICRNRVKVIRIQENIEDWKEISEVFTSCILEGDFYYYSYWFLEEEFRELFEKLDMDMTRLLIFTGSKLLKNYRKLRNVLGVEINFDVPRLLMVTMLLRVMLLGKC